MVHYGQNQIMELYYEHPTDQKMNGMYKTLCKLNHTFSRKMFFSKDYDKNLFSNKKSTKSGKISFFYRALIPEIYFLNQSILNSKQNEKTTVVYITDSGSTVVVLSKLYPDIHFHIYPSGEVTSNCIDRRLITIKNVTVFDIPVREKRNPGIVKILLICNTACVKNKMHILNKQKEWYRLINPRYALLKFQLYSYNGQTEYFDGKLLLPVFSNANCTQTRLIVSSETYKMWDHEYHDKFIYTMNINRLCKRRNINVSVLTSVLNDYRKETKFTYVDVIRIIRMTLTQKQQLEFRQTIAQPLLQNLKQSSLERQRQCWRSH